MLVLIAKNGVTSKVFVEFLIAMSIIIFIPKYRIYKKNTLLLYSLLI